MYYNYFTMAGICPLVQYWILTLGQKIILGQMVTQCLIPELKRFWRWVSCGDRTDSRTVESNISIFSCCFYTAPPAVHILTLGLLARGWAHREDFWQAHSESSLRDEGPEGTEAGLGRQQVYNRWIHPESLMWPADCILCTTMLVANLFSFTLLLLVPFLNVLCICNIQKQTIANANSRYLEQSRRNIKSGSIHRERNWVNSSG